MKNSRVHPTHWLISTQVDAYTKADNRASEWYSAFEAATIEATLRRVAQAASWPSRCEVIVCVEINQCVGSARTILFPHR